MVEGKVGMKDDRVREKVGGRGKISRGKGTHAHIHGRLPAKNYAELVVGEALEEVDGDELYEQEYQRMSYEAGLPRRVSK